MDVINFEEAFKIGQKNAKCFEKNENDVLELVCEFSSFLHSQTNGRMSTWIDNSDERLLLFNDPAEMKLLFEINKGDKVFPFNLKYSNNVLEVVNIIEFKNALCYVLEDISIAHIIMNNMEVT